MAYARPAASSRSLRRVAMAFGSEGDPIFNDVVYEIGAETLTDPREQYLLWASTVKQYGGAVSVMPHVNKGAAAARYPFDVIYPPPGYTLNPIFKRPPDDWSKDSAYGYYRAPEAVLAYTMSTQLTKAQNVPGEPAPRNPDWYEQLLALAKFAPWVIGGLILLNLMSALPRGRRE